MSPTHSAVPSVLVFCHRLHRATGVTFKYRRQNPNVLSKLLSLLIGSRWRTFCGFSRKAFLVRTERALRELEYDYRVEDLPTTAGERVMLGAGDGNRVSVCAPEAFDIDIIEATVDPLTDFGLKIFVPEDQRKEMTTDLCVVDISVVDETTRPAIARFIERVVEPSERPPWRLTHHVGFRLAVLLRLKVRLLWRYWLNMRPDTAE